MFCQEIYDILNSKYPKAECELSFNSDYELIVAVILSAQCTDKRVNQITPLLFKKYPTIFDLASANLYELKEIIKTCGFFNNKSNNCLFISPSTLFSQSSVMA